jgi:predicted TIM-barrel fold metal-dependent hydrolase
MYISRNSPEPSYKEEDMSVSSLIDVHHHVIPPEVRARLADHGVTEVGGIPVPRWDEARELEVLDRHRISAAVVSISDTGQAATEAKLVRLIAREANEFYAGLVARYPRRFGAFASLPLPDVEAALTELEYALHDLRLDGVMLLSNYAGRYPGDGAFDPVLAELDRRSATVFLHPATPPGSPTPELPTFLIDYVFETTRAVGSLLRSGALEHYTNIRLVLAHAGGTIPYLAGRLALGEAPIRARGVTTRLAGMPVGGAVAGALADAVLDRNERRVDEALGDFYYDTALSTATPALRALDAIAGPERIVFGSDYPYAPEPLIGRTARGIAAHWHDGALSRITQRNALDLFPRLGGDPSEAMNPDARSPNGARAEGRLRRAVRALARLRPLRGDKKLRKGQS